MKVKFLFFILFFILQQLEAQNVTWSQPFTEDKRMQYLKIIGSDEDGFYLLRSNLTFADNRDHSGFRNRKYALEYFDFSMHQKWNHELLSSVPDAKIIAIEAVNNKILV